MIPEQKLHNNTSLVTYSIDSTPGLNTSDSSTGNNKHKCYAKNKLLIQVFLLHIGNLEHNSTNTLI